jgi:outer membrane lipoprotein-sorting protein
MNKFWRTMATTAALIVVSAGSALALPKTMELTSDTTVLNGTDRMTFRSLTRVKDGRMRVETNGSGKTSAAPITSTMIVDPNAKVMYMVNEKTKSAMRVKLDQAGSQMGFGPSSLSPNPAEITKELKKKGAKIIGAEALIGHPCDIWELSQKAPNGEPGRAKLWLAKDIGMPLKAELSTKSKGVTMTLLVNSVKTDLALEDGLFRVPASYKVTDMADLAKKMKDAGKSIPSGIK